MQNDSLLPASLLVCWRILSAVIYNSMALSSSGSTSCQVWFHFKRRTLFCIRQEKHFSLSSKRPIKMLENGKNRRAVQNRLRVGPHRLIALYSLRNASCIISKEHAHAHKHMEPLTFLLSSLSLLCMWLVTCHILMKADVHAGAEAKLVCNILRAHFDLKDITHALLLWLGLCPTLALDISFLSSMNNSFFFLNLVYY